MNKSTISIGAASRLLGVSTHALRKWEDRYGAIQPARSAGGDRRYSGEHLERLKRLKTLVDNGQPIGAIAALSDRELEALLRGFSAPTRAIGRRLSVAVIGERLNHELRRQASRIPGVEVSAHAAEAADLADTQADAIAAEFGNLGEDTEKALEEIRAHTGVEHVVIVYGYGSIQAAERLSDSRTALVRRPLNHREFARTVVALVGSTSAGPPELGLPPHRFSRDVLAQMAMISPELACECPRHVGQLLIELSDFEAYSAECEITKPQDASIHNMLRRTAATSRALFERALIELAEAEGIDLDAPRVLSAD